ncbi:hypothetical protein RAA17_20145 [Komagataeibacter rhaeticus]|nr:hypothetical protein [Komagataeibacter rhaeticus]
MEQVGGRTVESLLHEIMDLRQQVETLQARLGKRDHPAPTRAGYLLSTAVHETPWEMCRSFGEAFSKASKTAASLHKVAPLKFFFS